jgi:hypothetical protein
VGIRTKLVASLSAILLLLTVILGAAFAVREQQVILELKRDHLRHSAELAAGLLKGSDAENLQAEIDALNISPANGPRFRFTRRSDHVAPTHDPTSLPASPDPS